MRISEIFYSIQGEGELTGVPSVFIRTSGCNLRCAWCDTPYASWHPEGEEVSEGAILEQTLSYPANHVVLTGGEPMIAKGVRALADRLRKAGKHITIETAGTVAPNEIACDLASLSPKLSNSTPAPGTIDAAWIERHEASRLNPAVLRDWLRYPAYQIKFVVAAPSDLLEIETFLAAIGESVPAHRVQLMPEGTDSATLRSRYDFLLDACKSSGWRLTSRLHVDWFGNTRGT